MNTKAKGRNNDNKTIKFLSGFGFYKFMKSAASSGDFDLITYNHKGIVFVQTKTNSKPHVEEILKLMQTRTPECALRFIFVWVDHVRIKEGPTAYLLTHNEDSMQQLTKDELFELLLQFG